MNKYGKIAIMAVQELNWNRAITPLEAWEKSRLKIEGGNLKDSKGCPKSTFLALCETGKVKGVADGNYTKARENKVYALRALTILEKNPDKKYNSEALWRVVLGNEEKSHNSQMDVVLALWEQGYLGNTIIVNFPHINSKQTYDTQKVDRRRFKEEMSKYERSLELKAQNNSLSFNEKEEYERIKRNNAYKQQERKMGRYDTVKGYLIVGALIIISMYMSSTQSSGYQGSKTMGIYTKKQMQQSDIVQEMNHINVQLNELQKIYNNAIEYYNTNGHLKKTFIEEINKIDMQIQIKEVTGLQEKFEEYKAAQKQFLEYLVITEKVDTKYAINLQNKVNEIIEAYSWSREKVIKEYKLVENSY